MKTCEECDERRKTLVAPMQIFAAFAAVPVPAGVKSAVWSSISDATGAPHGSRRWRRWLVTGAVVAFVGLGAGLVAGIATRSQTPTDTTTAALAPPSTISAPEEPSTVPNDPDVAPDPADAPSDDAAPDRTIPDDPDTHPRSNHGCPHDNRSTDHDNGGAGHNSADHGLGMGVPGGHPRT